jgi:hypothetical protein
LYEAATNALEQMRAEKIRLGDLPHARLKQFTTLVIPPSQAMQYDDDIVAQLDELQRLRTVAQAAD